jgi:hypothetical protein
MVLFSSRISVLIFLSDVLPADESGVMRSPTIILAFTTLSFILRGVCFMNVGAPMFSTYIFWIIISSCWIVLFISIYWTSLSLLTDFCLKNTLSDMRISTLACFCFLHAWYIFLQIFTFSLCVSLVVVCFF